MASIKKKETGPISDIVKSISYGTGLICAKVTHLGRVTKTKEWKDVFSTTQGIVKNAGKAVKDSITEMKESFDEGVESIVDEANDSIPLKPKVRKKEVDDIQDLEAVVKEQKVESPEEKVETREEEVTAQDKEVVLQEEEIIAQKQEAVIQEVKENEAYPPLPAEIEPAEVVEIHEELMDEEDEPKEKSTPPKPKKKITKAVFENKELLGNPSEFTIGEFKKDGKDPKSLMGSIKKNKPEISLNSADPLDWLNELLASGDNGQPLKYDIQETPEICQAKEAFEGSAGEEKIQQLIKLNRLILEQAYPLKCPKIQIEDSKQDKKTKRSKDSDSGLNLN